jgi:hypothetical protein
MSAETKKGRAALNGPPSLAAGPGANASLRLCSKAKHPLVVRSIGLATTYCGTPPGLDHLLDPDMRLHADRLNVVRVVVWRLAWPRRSGACSVYRSICRRIARLLIGRPQRSNQRWSPNDGALGPCSRLQGLAVNLELAIDVCREVGLNRNSRILSSSGRSAGAWLFVQALLLEGEELWSNTSRT